MRLAPGVSLLLTRPHDLGWGAFRRLENLPLGSQAVGGRVALRSKLVVLTTAQKFPMPGDFPLDFVRVFAVVVVRKLN